MFCHCEASLGRNLRPIKNWMTRGRCTFFSSPTWKRELHYTLHLRVRVRTEELPASRKFTSGYICSSHYLPALAKHFVLINSFNSIITVWERCYCYPMSQVGSLGTERLSDLSKVTQLLNRIWLHTPYAKFGSMLHVPNPYLMYQALCLGHGDAARKNITQSSPQQRGGVSFLSLLAFLTYS